MKPKSPRRPARTTVAIACVLAVCAGALALACSNDKASVDPSPSCTALALCCAGLSGPEGASCESAVSGASEPACMAALSTLVKGGGCGQPSDAGAPVPTVDTAVPCPETGACQPGTSKDAGGLRDASGPGVDATAPGIDCQPAGTCSSGEPLQVCIMTGASGACTSAVIMVQGGGVFACASCSDCAAATASAEAQCSASPPPAVDAGVDAEPDCGTPPALHPETEAGVYCPFTPTGPVHCAAGQECCETPSTVANGSSCQPAGEACAVAGSLSWACDGPLDCAGSDAGAVCCAAGTVALDPTCDYERGSTFTGSHCGTSCAAGEVPLCDSTLDPCPSGTTCTPFKVAGVVLGTCL